MASVSVFACKAFWARLIFAESTGSACGFAWSQWPLARLLLSQYITDVHAIQFYVHYLGGSGRDTDASAIPFLSRRRGRVCSETTKLGDARYALIKEYANNYEDMTDAQAESLVNKWLRWTSKLRPCASNGFRNPGRC